MVKLEGPVVDAQLVLSIIAIIYYVLILYVIFTAKSANIRSSFFHIFMITGVCDILGIIALEWNRVEDKLSFGPSFELMTRLAGSMTGINFFTHILGCFLMTCNRFTAVRFPQQQSHIWCKRNVWALLIFEIVFSIAIHYQVLVTNFVYKPKPDGGWINIGRSGLINKQDKDSFKNLEKTPLLVLLNGESLTIPVLLLNATTAQDHEIETRVIDSVITILYEIVSIMVISYTIYLIHKELRKSNRRLARDVGLFFVTVISSIMSILQCTYDISFLFQVECPALLWVRDLFDINFFLVMSINAYSIIFLCRALRQEFRQRLCWKPVETHSFHTTVRVF